ncbi:VWA domain-containing protein [Actinocrinis puniceicyclus]|uniref:VWA domain-containing protein n=1 Tax=Actinocrinis puniceicyclus TaxID=977794 RepID=A0A8J7WGZ7_9ACTN|nr:vWA domain-containing protein [Actinocrinis puniceicyclus]MBS2962008.1 VWA domain-containing protein [Actinocrinis puniceicyclus]
MQSSDAAPRGMAPTDTSSARRRDRGRRHVRGRGPAALAASLLLSLSAFATPAAATATGASAGLGTLAADASTAPQPIDFVVLVDESGSITPSEMNDERAAASLLTQSEIAQDSKAAVIGFGSSNQTGQSPVDMVCPLTPLDSSGRQLLSGCVGQLHKRTTSQGPDTDFPNAIQQALDTLGSAQDSATKLIFMLTDGQLDVRNSPQYGSDPEHRQANAESALAEKLQSAAQAKVEIWPLGFGPDVDGAQLSRIAAGAYTGQGLCSGNATARPVMHVVGGSSDVFNTLLQAFAGARCGNGVFGGGGKLPNPGSLDLNVTIPPVASTGSLVVIKRDPHVVVSYYDPQNREVPQQGTAFGSTFQDSGQNSAVEALRISDPLPGTWRIHVTAPAGYGGEQVMSAVIWQGILHSFITVSPPAPYAGQAVVVRVHLQTRAGVVLYSADQLAGIGVSATLAGTGLSAQTIRLADDGNPPDKSAHDGEFTGRLTIPANASGSLTLTGNVTGQGVVGDQRPTFLTVAKGAALLTGTATIDEHQVTPGGTASGTFEAHNMDGKAHVLRLTLSGLSSGAQASVSPATITVPAASQQTYSFRIAFGSGTPQGFQPGELDVTDTTTGLPVDAPPIDVTIVPPPTWWSTWGWAVETAAVIVLAAIAAAALLARSRREQAKLGGIRLVLYRGDEVLNELRPMPSEREVGFVVAGAGGANPTLRRQAHAPRWVLRRTKRGAVLQLRPPTGKPTELQTRRRTPLGDGLELAVTEPAPPPAPPVPGRRKHTPTPTPTPSLPSKDF